MALIVSATVYEADGTTVVQRLDTASGLQWLDELNDVGSFSFTVPAEDSTQLAIGHIVKVALGDRSDDYVFAGVIETLKVEQSGVGEGVARVREVAGRGVRALLENAVVYNSGDDNRRPFTSVSAGQIMKTLFDEAQARGALAELNIDFSNSLDSNGDAYAETLTVDESVGSSLLNVAARHQELAVDVRVTPNLVLKYVNERGSDLTTGANPVVFRVGWNVGELLEERTGPVHNAVLLSSGAASPFSTESDATSISTYGRRETFLSLSSTEDGALVTLAGQNLLDEVKNPGDGITIQVNDVGPIAYLDYNIGDTVVVVDAAGARKNLRVQSIAVSVDESGRPTFVPELGRVRADLTKRLAALLARVERASGGTTSAISTPDVNGGFDLAVGGGAELDYGAVATYNANTRQGTLDIGGTTYNFENATGFGLDVGDTIVVTDVSGLVDKIAVGIYDRVGSYTPIILNNPQAVTGFPFDGDLLPEQFNYCFDDAGFGNFYNASSVPTSSPVAWYGSNILGFTGRVIAYINRRTDTTAQPPIVFYDVETGGSTIINRTAGVGTSNRSHSIAAIGDRLFVTYDGTSGSCIESYDSSTGTWSTHAVQYAVFAGVSDDRAWWLGKMSGETNPTRWRIISIDSSGTLSHQENPDAATGGSQVFARAKSGKMYFRINTTGADLYNFDTNVAAASASITNNSGATTAMPYSTTAAAGGTEFNANARAYFLSDIADNGDCYYMLRTGSPVSSWGFAVIDETTLAATVYTTITSATGSPADGEMVMAQGLQLAGSQVVLCGGVREDVADLSLGRSTSVVPAYWRTDGTTTVRVDDSRYFGLTGGTGTGTDGFASAGPIHKVDVTSNIYLHARLSRTNLGTSGVAVRDEADVSGPAFVDAFTV
jgi:hypothetical protein